MNIEEMKKKCEVSKMLLDMMCEVTQDKEMLCFRDSQNLNEKIVNTIKTESVTDEQYEKLIQIIKQFDNVIDEFIKEEKIENKKGRRNAS